MEALIRDAPIGQLIRYVTRNKMLLYPEEKADFHCPACYAEPDATEKRLQEAMRSTSSASMAKSPDEIADEKKAALEPAEPTEPTEPIEAVEEPVEDDREDLERLDTVKDLEKSTTLRSTMSRVNTRSALKQSTTRLELEEAFRQATHDLTKEASRPILPERTSDGTILVDWYTTDDPENPQNWSQGKKAITAAQICLYTLAFYMGSAIYTPSEEPLIIIYGISQEVASLGLSLYVLAYGLGPLLFSPLSEIPSIGRNPPYILSFGIFVILCIPTALVTDVPGLLVLRFLQGFFGSPCLATGGASLQDIYSLIKLPYILCIWALAATCGPAMGPVISGFSVPAENWHWSLWEMLWLSGPISLSMFLFLPETSSSNILLRRAQRLRKLTGDSRLKAQSEIDQANTKPGDVVYEALVRPAQLIFLDPAIGFTAGYVALCYGIYYSFFEAFPLVYIALYGFNIGEMGLTFLSITVGVIISIVVYYAYIWWVVEPDIIKNGLGAPEKRLIPALFSSFFLPLGLFLFGWTGNGHIHWIVSVIGIMLFTIGESDHLQCILGHILIRLD